LQSGLKQFQGWGRSKILLLVGGHDFMLSVSRCNPTRPVLIDDASAELAAPIEAAFIAMLWRSLP
jgi:hypothetical protein